MNLATDFSPVLRPTAEAKGLPNEMYLSQELAATEVDRVFGKSWSCIGFGKDLPNPGDVHPIDLLGLPLLALRDRSGAVKVFHNVCRHRGLKLVEQPGRVDNVLRCPYHSWAYDLDGNLRATPHIGGPGKHSCEGFDKENYGLRPVRTAVWCDLIFVDLSGTAPDFETHIAPLEERWKDLDLSLLKHGGPDSTVRFELDCNWKLAVENYCESYHLPWVHPNLNRYSRLEDHYHILGGDRFAGQGTRVYAPTLSDDGSRFPDFPDLPEAWQTAAEYIALFPNVLLALHRDHFYAVLIEPNGPARCRETMEIYYVGNVAEDETLTALREMNRKTWRQVFAEDVGVVEGMQRGRVSPAFDGGVFSPVMDTPTHLFHCWIARRMGVLPPC